MKMFNFIRDGVNIEVERVRNNKPVLFLFPFGNNLKSVDSEHLHSLSDFRANIKLDTRIEYISDSRKGERKISNWWNMWVGKYIEALHLKRKNYTLASFLKQFYGESHKAHSELLDQGIEAITLKLYLPSDD